MKSLFAGAVFLLLIYLPGLPEGYFIIDDATLVGAPQVRHLDVASIRSIFTPGLHVDFYPVRDLSYSLDWMYGFNLEVNALPARLQNFTWLLVIALLIAQLLTLQGLKREEAYGVSLLWLVLPLHSEMLMWNSARKDLLALAFILMAAVTTSKALKRGLFRSGDMALALFFFALSLGSKATYIFVPVAFAFYAVCKLRGHFRQAVFVLGLVGALLLSLGSAWIQIFVYSRVNDMQGSLSPGAWAETLLASTGRLVTGLIDPPLMAIDIANWGEWKDLNSAYLPVGIAALAAAAVFLIYGLFRAPSPRFFFLALVSLALLAVTPGFNPMHRAFYSARYLEPFVLIALFAFFGREHGFAGTKKPKRILQAIIVLLMLLTLQESTNWASGRQILEKAVSISPKNPALLSLLFEEKLNLKRWGQLTSLEVSNLDKDFAEIYGMCKSRGADIANSLCRNAVKNAPAYWENYLPQDEISQAIELRERAWPKFSAPSDASSPTPETRWSRLAALCEAGDAETARSKLRSYMEARLLSPSWINEKWSLTRDPDRKSKLKTCLKL